MKIKRNINLAPLTTFKIGGKAQYFTEINNIKELKEAINFAENKKQSILILGGGSNILLPDNILNKLILRIAINGLMFKRIGDKIMINIGAGENWDKVVAKIVAKKLWGVENLSLIPGTVGGAVYQNIGAYGIELKDILESVEVFDIKSNRIKILSNKQCRFGYRDSIFQHKEGSNYIIIGALLKLKKKSGPNLSYPGLAKYFDLHKPTVAEIRKAIIKIRKSKLVYPSTNLGTVGSFFKNPIIPIAKYRLLVKRYPELRGIEVTNGIKLSAGQLIEIAGWKGKKYGKTEVSDKHALVLISHKGATAMDIIRLGEKIKKSIKNKFGIGLDPEVKIVY